MSSIILTIGTSGSGKTTWIKTLPNNKYNIVSMDNIRKDLTGNVSDKSKYQSLVKQLACPIGSETTPDELLWNEGIIDSIDKLFANTSKETENAIRLNHI